MSAQLLHAWAGLSCLTVLILPRPALAAWPSDPTVNVPICTAAAEQASVRIAADGHGGAILTWQDARNGTFDIYARRVLATGVVDPAWPADGRVLCAATQNQLNPRIVADGNGGAIVVWEDERGGGNSHIYAQHVLAAGAVDPNWPADGRAVCTASGFQTAVEMVSDGAGGAIVTWYDGRSFVTNNDIYAHHVLATGVDPAWPVNGRALCLAAGDQYFPKIVTDGAGGAIVAWWHQAYDPEFHPIVDIYAQHVMATGAVDPAWPANGRVLTLSSFNGEDHPEMVADGSGGAIVAWLDNRKGTEYDVYAQHVLATGVVDPAWPSASLAVCTAAGDKGPALIETDGAGGAIVAWNGSVGNSLYAQHLLAAGGVDPAWPADGRTLGVGSSLGYPVIVADGSGGAILGGANYDDLNNPDIYAHHVLATGLVDPAWLAAGSAVSTAASYQTKPAIVADGTGGAILAWEDLRNFQTTSTNIYAQRVAANGQLGGEVALDVPGEVRSSFALDPVRPNPTRTGAILVRFTLAGGVAASLDLLDVQGRRIAAREVGSLGAGRHVLDLGEGCRLSSGIYLVRLRQGASVRTTRVVVLD